MSKDISSTLEMERVLGQAGALRIRTHLSGCRDPAEGTEETAPARAIGIAAVTGAFHLVYAVRERHVVALKGGGKHSESH